MLSLIYLQAFNTYNIPSVELHYYFTGITNKSEEWVSSVPK